MIFAVIVFAFSLTSADAHRHRHSYHHIYIGDRGSSAITGQPTDDLISGKGPPENTIPRHTFRTATEVLPAGWWQQAPDPNWTGQRYLSPDSAAWFAVYETPVEQESIAAHMKTIVFVDGEVITYLRGERNWVAVSGVKGDRIFYRKAVLACGGKSWHHVALEYPAAEQRHMEKVVVRAAAATDGNECEAPLWSSRQ
jgi:hypothetical protein